MACGSLRDLSAVGSPSAILGALADSASLSGMQPAAPSPPQCTVLIRLTSQDPSQLPPCEALMAVLNSALFLPPASSISFTLQLSPSSASSACSMTTSASVSLGDRDAFYTALDLVSLWLLKPAIPGLGCSDSIRIMDSCNIQQTLLQAPGHQSGGDVLNCTSDSAVTIDQSTTTVSAPLPAPPHPLPAAYHPPPSPPPRSPPSTRSSSDFLQSAATLKFPPRRISPPVYPPRLNSAPKALRHFPPFTPFSRSQARSPPPIQALTHQISSGGAIPVVAATSTIGLSDVDIQGILSVHNQYRTNHQSQPLTWSNDLAQAALLW